MDTWIEVVNAIANTLTAALLAFTSRELRAARKERRWRQQDEGRIQD
jgi:hypothetical protein